MPKIKSSSSSNRYGLRPIFDSAEDDADVFNVSNEYAVNDTEQGCTSGRVAKGFGRVFATLALLYMFLIGLGLMTASFKVLTGRATGALFDEFTENPIAGLMVGVVGTVLVQSSSTSTSIIVGLVDAGAISVHRAVPVIFGTNIGTTITSVLVSIAHAKKSDEFRRAFAGAIVHGFFNVLVVVIALPLEVGTGVFKYLATELVKPIGTDSGVKFPSPTDAITKPVVNQVLYADDEKIKQLALGNPINGTLMMDSCWFAQAGLSETAAGLIAFGISMIFLCASLIFLVSVLKSALSGATSTLMTKINDMNGYLAILAGIAITIAVQSSSVVTSAMIPFIGIGALSLEKSYPIALGSNIGTTITPLLAAMTTGNPNTLKVALVHLFFNTLGAILFYPIPFLRAIPIGLARFYGEAVSYARFYAVVYSLGVFLIVPGIFMGLSYVSNLALLIGGIATCLLLVFACGAIYGDVLRRRQDLPWKRSDLFSWLYATPCSQCVCGYSTSGRVTHYDPEDEPGSPGREYREF